MTAEGDNCVLMQKVAKERLAAFKPLPMNPDLPENPANIDYLHDLLNRRENQLFMVISLQNLWFHLRKDYKSAPLNIHW